MTREEAGEAIKEAYGNSEYTNEIIKALEREPCEDAVSRAEVLNLVRLNAFHAKSQIKAIENMPSVTPQEPKKGSWIMTGDYFTGAYESIDYVKCSCCGEESLEEGNYCSNCGADMREVSE